MLELDDPLVRAMLILSGQWIDPVNEQRPDQMPYKYSAILIKFPDEMSRKICGWGDENIADLELIKNDPQDNRPLGREYDIHVTLKYGLETTNPVDVINLIEDQQVKPFDVTLGKISIFNQDAYDVVKLDVSGDALMAFNQVVVDALPANDKHPVYQPHATIAYLQKGFGKAYTGVDDFVGQSVHVDRIVFTVPNGKQTVIPLYGVSA